MKIETFFEKFDLFAEAPGAVTKMRELVLELAVRGNLLPDSTDDTPASELIGAIKHERAKLVKARRIKARPIAPINSEEQPFKLPSVWEWARLSDVGYELGQKVPDKKFTYIDVGSIDSMRGKVSDGVEKLEAGQAPSRARKIVSRGTVIYSTVRPYLLNIAIIDQDYSPEPIASTAFGILHPFTGIDNRYLFYWLRSVPFTAYVQRFMKGLAYPAINDEKFYCGLIPVPPEKEQKRIVAKVDELMSLCDRLEAQQQEQETRYESLSRASLDRFAEAPTPANLNFIFHKSYDISLAELRKTVLNLAVQGKLVAQDSNDISIHDTFQGINCINTNSSERSDLIYPWRSCTYRSLTKLVTSGSRGWKDYYSSSGSIFIRTQNIKADNFVLEDVAYVNLPKSAEGMRTRVLQNDILITITGANVTKAARIKEPIPEAYVSQHIALTRPRWPEMSEWLHLCFITPRYIRGTLEKLAYGDKPGLNLENIRSLIFPVPPLAEQRRIVAKVDQLMAMVNQLESQLAQSKSAAKNLLDALIAELTK